MSSAIVRCARCREALTAWRYFDGAEISMSASDEDLQGPCISPITGEALDMHPRVFVEVTTSAPEPPPPSFEPPASWTPDPESD